MKQMTVITFSNLFIFAKNTLSRLHFMSFLISKIYSEPVARLNVWQMEGEPELKELLKFGLNPDSIANCVVVISLDFSQPWNLIESLNKWLAVLQVILPSLNLKLMNLETYFFGFLATAAWSLQ